MRLENIGLKTLAFTAHYQTCNVTAHLQHITAHVLDKNTNCNALNVHQMCCKLAVEVIYRYALELAN